MLVSLLSHLLIRDVHSVWVYLARILYNISLAGAFGASITFISLRTPRHRTAEVIGALGSSGFIGMALGPAVADWLFALPGTPRTQVDRMFLAASVMTVLALVLTSIAVRGQEAEAGRRGVVPCRSGGWCGATIPARCCWSRWPWAWAPAFRFTSCDRLRRS